MAELKLIRGLAYVLTGSVTPCGGQLFAIHGAGHIQEGLKTLGEKLVLMLS